MRACRALHLRQLILVLTAIRSAFVAAQHNIPMQHQGAPHTESYAAICAIVKNQHEDIREWVDHHLALGVDKLYIFDNNSTVPVDSEIQDYIKQGKVYTETVYGRAKQLWVFEECLRRYSERHSWMLFIDIDEYLWNTHPMLHEVLQQYNEYGVLVIPQKIVGSSGHITKPQGGLRKNFVHCHNFPSPGSRWFKAFVHTKVVRGAGVGLGWSSPHYPDFCKECKYNSACAAPCVDQERRKVANHQSQMPLPDSALTIWHYMIRSREDFHRKINRGAGTAHNASNFGEWFFIEIDHKAVVECMELARFAQGGVVPGEQSVPGA